MRARRALFVPIVLLSAAGIVRSQDDPPGALACGDTATGVIDAVDEEDVWTFEGEADDLVSISLVQTGVVDEDFSVRLDLLAPDGSILQRFQLPSWHTIHRLPVAGSYSLSVYDAQRSFRGDYAVAVVFLGAGRECADVWTDCGVTRTVVIDAPGEVELISYDATEDGRGAVQLSDIDRTDERFSPRVDVVSPSGEIVRRFAIQGFEFAFDFPIDEVGTYSILAYDLTHTHTGRFNVKLNCVPRLVRGDCNGDGRVLGSVSDAVFLLAANFNAGPLPECLAACDADGDGAVVGQVTDSVYLLNYNFLGGSPPPAPFPECDLGIWSDWTLGCDVEPAQCE